ncbi:MAG TPA: PPC domain-containing DNA-binding protein [Albitalea sp.]|nr:PPC domain-containing DNA-binding protein [Albitalea sp.]
MRAKLINEVPERTFALILDTNDEVVSSLERFAAENSLTASRLTAIGAFDDVTLGYFEWERKDYLRKRITEQLEVLSLVGDIALDAGRPKLHAHVVLGRRDMSTLGGHLLHAIVRPTLEVLVTDAPEYLRREHDPQTGLALIRVGS